AARALAMVHVAMFDAIEAIDNNFHTYTQPTVVLPRDASEERAAAVAAHDVLVSLFSAQADQFTARLDAAAPGPDDLELGSAVAQAVLSARADDGSDVVMAYTPGAAPGEWIPTPPAFAAVLFPQWPAVKP